MTATAAQPGVYTSVNWINKSNFERLHAYSEVIIRKFTLSNGIPLGLEKKKKN